MDNDEHSQKEETNELIDGKVNSNFRKFLSNIETLRMDGDEGDQEDEENEDDEEEGEEEDDEDDDEYNEDDDENDQEYEEEYRAEEAHTEQIIDNFNDVTTQLLSHPEQKLKQSDVEQIFRLVNDKNVFIFWFIRVQEDFDKVKSFFSCDSDCKTHFTIKVK